MHTTISRNVPLALLTPQSRVGHEQPTARSQPILSAARWKLTESLTVTQQDHHVDCYGFETMQPSTGQIYPTCTPCDGRCREWNS
jgi:hypothetical protein